MSGLLMRRILIFSFCAAQAVTGQNIFWFSDASETNLDGSGTAMDAGFQFELGVFTEDFTPTAGNRGEWQAHWAAADVTSYNPTTRRFADSYDLSGNTAPFTAGAEAWILGRRDGPTGSDWILFRSSAWFWPAADPIGQPVEWNAGDADVMILGSVNADGSPFLMQAAGFQSYAQWRTVYLAGEPLGGPADDPDLDGTPNLLEFVFGTHPKMPGAPVPTPVALVDGHLQITIPRRADRLASLVVEVSDDLATWSSGPEHAAIAEEGPAALVVRDSTPYGPARPRRFLRLRAASP